MLAEADASFKAHFCINHPFSSSHCDSSYCVGCQGRGIFLTKSIDQVSEVEGAVAQQYLPSPMLVDGFKFDLRLYGARGTLRHTAAHRGTSRHLATCHRTSVRLSALSLHLAAPYGGALRCPLAVRAWRPLA